MYKLVRFQHHFLYLYLKNPVRDGRWFLANHLEASKPQSTTGRHDSSEFSPKAMAARLGCWHLIWLMSISVLLDIDGRLTLPQAVTPPLSCGSCHPWKGFSGKSLNRSLKNIGITTKCIILIFIFLHDHGMKGNYFFLMWWSNDRQLHIAGNTPFFSMLNLVFPYVVKHW